MRTYKSSQTGKAPEMGPSLEDASISGAFFRIDPSLYFAVSAPIPVHSASYLTLYRLCPAATKPNTIECRRTNIGHDTHKFLNFHLSFSLPYQGLFEKSKQPSFSTKIGSGRNMDVSAASISCRSFLQRRFHKRLFCSTSPIHCGNDPKATGPHSKATRLVLCLVHSTEGHPGNPIIFAISKDIFANIPQTGVFI